MKIPNCKPYFSNKEIEYITDAINKETISGDGYYTRLVQSFLEGSFDIKKVLMTTSATHALEMAAFLIDLHPGDEVIMPSFTFPSTANAVMLHGARPVFAEIKVDTLNIEPSDIERKITTRTKAIIPVHYAGVGCEMDKIMKLAADYGLYVIEDAAQAVNAKYNNKYLGSWGHLGCYSFHGTKNYTCGEGGAILINTDDKNICDRSEIIRQKGTNRTSFIKGEVKRYSWVDVGSSYSPSDILMALLYGQLSDMDYITQSRKKVYTYYYSQLKKYTEHNIIKIMSVPESCEINYHIFYVMFSQEDIRNKVIYKLNNRGISASTHFVPLHSSLMGTKLGYKKYDLPITEKASRGLMRLPVYANMSYEEMEFVISNLIEILEEFSNEV